MEACREHKMIDKIKKWIKNPYNATLIVLLIITIFFRLRYLFQESIWVDETAYYLLAKYIKETFSFGPFSPFTELRLTSDIVIVFWSFFFNLFTAGRMMALTFAVLGIIFSYLIGKEIKNEILGLLAATLVAFNPYLWFHSSRTLIDSPLTTMFIICAYFLIKLENKFSLKNLVYLIIALVFTIQTKYVGVLFIFIILIYYLLKFLLVIQNKKQTLTNLFKSKISLLYLIFLLPLYAVKKIIFEGIGSLQYDPFFIEQIPIMLSEPIMWLAVFGLIISLFYKKKSYLIIASWTLLIYATISLIFITIPIHYETANSMNLRSFYAFTGYDEAGKWIQDNVGDGSTVFVMSTSWANFFSNNLYNRISIDNSAKLKVPEDLISELNNYKDRPFYLIIDNWEAGAQPKWLTPTEENINNIISMGFELKNVITKKYPLDNQQFTEIYNKIWLFTINIDDRNLQEIPAIFIFKKLRG